MKKKLLDNYAKLIVESGINLQKGQDVIIQANTETADFTLLVVGECYRKGARLVRVEWTNQNLDKLNYNWRSEKTLKTVEKWEVEKYRDRVKKLPCLIWLDSDDPDALKGVDVKKMGIAIQARGRKFKKMRDEMDGRYQWCIAGVPGTNWAKKLFPRLSGKAATDALWEKILFSSRALDDPIKAWEEHDSDLKKRCAYLNSLEIDSLHYISDEGTDLTVGLMEESVFQGGSETTIGERKVCFQPNIPSEECFTSPKKGRADGIVYATMPLCYNGNLIEDFHIRFKDGKAIEWKAGKNEELLGKLLTMDEGASYLGECALVPNSSPIRKSGILFYNTLFDENATCHLAFGEGFDSAVRGYENMTKEECRKKGVNDSMIHIDFMIGSDTLNIDAVTKDGRTVPLLCNGEWAF